jgi:hypothetical protein
MRANIILVVLICVLTTGCSSAPYVDEFTTDKPKQENIIGLYKFEDETVHENDDNKRFRYSSILLRPDGSFTATNVPYLINDSTQHNEIINVSGKWHLAIVGTIDNGWQHQIPYWGVTLTNMPESLNYFGFMGDKSNYKLIRTWDDPDLGLAMIFARK